MSDKVMEKDPDLRTGKDEKLERPRLYKVLLHNDDFTTFEFVVEVLRSIFHKPEGEARTITKEVHERGVGIAGVYTCEIAETKCVQVLGAAEHGECPLLASMEPE